MPRTSRPMQVLPIILRSVEVTGISDITPNMRRLTVTGDDLSAETVNGLPRQEFRSEGFDDHVKLVIPTAETESMVIGEQEEFRFRWNREVLSRTRDYTVRSVDPKTNSFTIDIVRHDSGLASDWAYSASIGDSLSFAGPKTCAGISEGIDFHLLVADETALPAVGRWLETVPPGTRGHIIIEVPSAEDIQEIATEADVEIDWLLRGATPPGESTLLFEAVQNLVLPEGRTYAWCAGEALTIAPIRRHLRRDLGLPQEDVEVVGYWRRVQAPQASRVAAGDDAGASDVPGSPEPADVPEVARADRGALPKVRETSESEAVAQASADAVENGQSVVGDVHEMTEILPPIITRIAVTLGIGDLVAGGITTAEAIAEESGIDAEGARVVLTAMCSLGLLERDGEDYGNTQAGAVLIGDGAGDSLDLDDPANRDLFSIVDLLDILRERSAATATPTSAMEDPTWNGRRRADANLDLAHRNRTLEHLQYVLDLIVDLDPIVRASSIALAGDAGTEVAAALVRRAPECGRSIHTPGGASLAGEQPWPEVEATLMLAGLTGASRADARALLMRILESSRSLVIVEPFTDEAEADDHQAEELVATFASTGNASWTTDEVRELLTALGADAVEIVDIGWGFGRFRRAVIAGRS